VGESADSIIAIVIIIIIIYVLRCEGIVCQRSFSKSKAAKAAELYHSYLITFFRDYIF